MDVLSRETEEVPYKKAKLDKEHHAQATKAEST